MKDKSYLIHSTRKGFPVAILSVCYDPRKRYFTHHGWTRQQNLTDDNIEDIAGMLDIPVRNLMFLNINTGKITCFGDIVD